MWYSGPSLKVYGLDTQVIEHINILTFIRMSYNTDVWLILYFPDRYGNLENQVGFLEYQGEIIVLECATIFLGNFPNRLGKLEYQGQF